MRCVKCGADNREARKFCAKCAAPLARLCPRCGASNEPGEDFCGECAAPLGQPPVPSEKKSSDSPILVSDASAAENVDGERKTVTALFADIKGSMELIEDLDPEEARAVVEPTLKLMIDAVHHYGGYVAQSTGDGIFALFGAPIAHEDHPQRGLLAALRMQQELKRYSECTRAEGRPPIQVRVGVNTGEVVLRVLKTGEAHSEYVPVGHSISLAARMQALAPIGSIAATEQVRKLCEGYFVFAGLGPTKVKGVSGLVNVYEVTGLGPLRTRLQRAAARGYTKFVGREREMEALRHAAEQARASRGQIVAAMAEAGVGKSRLFFEFKAKSRAGWMVLEAFSVSHGKASAYLPVIDLLHSYFDIKSDDDARKRREKVTGRVIALDHSLEDTLPYLFALLSIVEGEDPLVQMDAQIRRRRTQEAVKRILLRESLNQPLMVVFEDLHWIDEETGDFLNLLAEGMPSAPVLLLVSYRPDYSHHWNSKTYYAQLRLDPLGRESAEEMLSSLLGDGAELAPLRRVIIEKTEGNPLFMEEIFQALVEDGSIQRNGSVKLIRPVEQLRIPPTVQDILTSRIDRLPPEAKDLLQTLAVIGTEFPVALVRAVAPKPVKELDRMLNDFQLGELIYEQPAVGDTEYTFKHVLTQEVAYNSLLIETRNALHERTARAIEELYSDRLEDHLAELAHHYGRSAHAPKALEYLERAGEQALRRSAYADAIVHLRRGLELLAHLPEGRERDAREARLRNRLAGSLYTTQGPVASEAEQGYIRARKLSERIGDEEQLFVAVAGLATLYSNGGDLKKALEVGQDLLRMALAAQEPAALLEAHSVVATTFHELGDFRTSLEHANEGLKAFDPQVWPSTPFKPQILDCFTTGAWDLLWLGYPDQSLARCEEALRIAREHGTLALARALFAAAVVHGYRGNAKAAQEQAETLLALARKNGFPEYEAISLSCRGLALAIRGEAEEGLAECRRGLAIAEGTRLLVSIPFIETYIARLCSISGKVEEGLEAVAKGQASLDRNGKDAERSILYHLKGELLLMKEHNESAAEVCFKTAIDIARSQQAKYWELSYTTSLARLLSRQGKRDEARAMLAEIYNWFTEGFDTADLKDAKALLDELAR